jgi:hypothetical protein
MLQSLFQIIILRPNSSNDCLYFTTFARVVERILIIFITNITCHLRFLEFFDLQ